MTAIAERLEERRGGAHRPSRAVPALLGAAGLAGAAWIGAAATSERRAMQLIGAALLAAWTVAGAMLARKPGSSRLGALVAAQAAVVAILGATSSAGRDAGDFAFACNAAIAGILPALAMHLLLALPSGTLRTRARQVMALIGYAAGIATAIYLFERRPDPTLWPLAVQILASAVIGAVAVSGRTSRASGGDRRRITWLVWSTVVVAGIAAAVFTLRWLVGWPEHGAEVVAAFTVLIPLALALSTVDGLATTIDPLLANTISLVGLAALVAVAYLTIVVGLGRAPRQDERTLLVLSMIAAGVVALLYIPARTRLTRFANRFVYGERDAPDDVIRSFGRRLSRAVPMDELLLQMAESLRKTMALDAVEVWTGGHGALERTVSDPDRGGARIALSPNEEPVVARAGVSGPAWMKVWLPQMLAGHESPHVRIAPATHSGDLLGIILVERKADNRPLTQDDERTLAELARQVGLALHNVQLDSALQASLDEVRRQAAALQASRGRIVAAADAERRRIERNLHDGAQQHLVALAVKVRLARQLAGTDPAQANAILEELGGDVRDALTELRTLAHGIYPPLLADRGLGEALTAAATRSPLSTTVHVDGIERLPQEIEAAVYFCTLEALQNAGKYAGEGATATVRVWQDAGALLFEVVDTGHGFDAQRHGVGAGFTNMSDRLGAIGGSLRVESSPGRGTKVGGTIPLAE